MYARKLKENIKKKRRKVNIISIPTIFTAVDNFSSKVDGMSNKLTTFSEKASKYAEAGAKSALIGGAVLASLAMPVNAAIQFEDVMADVAKVTNTDIGSAAFNKLGDEAKELSGILAIMPDQAAGLMANLAQGVWQRTICAELEKWREKSGLRLG